MSRQLVEVKKLLYEGTIEMIDDMVNVDLVPTEPQGSDYSMQFLHEPATLVKAISVLKPSFGPDRPPEEPAKVAQNLAQNRFAKFATDSMNIHDLMDLYSTTPPKDMNPFPGLSSPKKVGEIVFTETINDFRGSLNEKAINGGRVQFTYRRVLL
jgi:hypothetical protein